MNLMDMGLLVVQVRTVKRPGTMYEKQSIERIEDPKKRAAAASRRWYYRHREELLASRKTAAYRKKNAAYKRTWRASKK